MQSGGMQNIERGFLRNSLVTAIEHNNSADIIKIYENNPLIINQILRIKKDFYSTPLLYGIYKGAVEAVETLLKCKANVNNGCDRSNPSTETKGPTFTLPLHYAIEVGAPDEITDLVLNQKPKTYSLDGQHRTALNLAISRDKYEIARKVIMLGKPTPIEELLTMMKRKYYVDVPASVWSAIGLQRLVKKGATPHILAQCAAENGHTGILQFLKEKTNYNLDKSFMLIHNPHMIGPRHNGKLIRGTQYLRRHQSETKFESKPFSAYGLLHIAAKCKQINIIHFLLQSGCNINQIYTEGRTVKSNRQTESPRCSDHYKTRVHFPRLRPLSLNDLKNVNLRHKGAPHKNVSSITSLEYQKTALEIALKMEHHDVVEFLLQSGARVQGLKELHDRMENADFKMANIILDHVDKSLLQNDTILECPALNYIAKCTNDFDIEEADKLVKTYIQHGYNLKNTLESPIHVALEFGNMAALEIYALNNADTNCTDWSGELPVTIVARMGDVGAMKLLVSKGANPLTLTNDGSSTLNSAIEQNHMEMVTFLISINEDINMKSNLTLRNKSIHNSTFVAPSVPSVVHFIDENIGWSPLALTVFHGKEDMLEYLLSNGALLSGLVELILSISCGHVKIAALLMPYYQESFTDIQYLDFPILNYLNPTAISEFSNDSRVLLETFIGRGYNINSIPLEPSGANFTLLHTAVLKEGLKMVMFLIENGAEINCLTSDCMSPLHMAALSGQYDMSNYLISQGSDVNSCGCHISESELMKQYILPQNSSDELLAAMVYETPLMLAVLSNHREIANILLQHGAKLQGVMELHISIRLGYFSISNLLIDNISTEMTGDAIDDSPALHQLAKMGGKYCNCDSLEMEIKKLIEKYCQKGYDINAVDCEGFTVLHLSIVVNNTMLVKILVEFGVDIDITTSPYNTGFKFPLAFFPQNLIKNLIGTELSPLLLAVMIENAEITELFLLNGAILNGLLELHLCLQNNLHRPALSILNRIHNNVELSGDSIENIPTLHLLANNTNDHYNCSSESIHVEQIIPKYIQAGYNIDVTDSDGCTLLLLAALEKNIFLVKKVVENGADINKTCEIVLLNNRSYRIGNRISYFEYLHNFRSDYRNQIELIKCVLGKICISALTIAVLNPSEEMTTFLLQNGGIPNGVAELHISLINGNVTCANKILEFLPSCHSLKEDKIGDIPTLQYVVKNQGAKYNAEMKSLICEYVRRGYDINASSSAQIPLLHSYLEASFKERSKQPFDFFISINECNIDVLHVGKSALTVLVSDCKDTVSGATFCGRGNRCDCKYYIKQLLERFASVDLCDLRKFVYHFGHADVLKLLFAAGVKFPEDFRDSIVHSSRFLYIGAQDYDLEKAEFLSFCDRLDEEKCEVKPLKYLSRIAFRRLHCAKYLINSRQLPEKIKSYIKLDEYLDTTS